MKLKKPKYQRAAAIAGGIILLVAAFLYLYVPWKAEQRLQKAAKQNGIDLQYQDFSLQPLSGDLSITGITASGGLPLNRYTLQFDNQTQAIHLHGIEWLALLGQTEIKLDQIQLQNPHIRATLTPRDSTAAADSSQQNKPNFRMQLGAFDCRSGRLDLQFADSSRPSVTVDTFHLYSEAIAWSDTTQLSGSLLRQAYADFRCIHMQRPDALHYLQLSQITAAVPGGQLWISGFDYNPLYSKTGFAQRTSVRKDRIQVSLNRLQAKGINYQALLKGQFLIQEVHAQNLDLRDYMDKRKPRDKPARPLLHQRLLQLSAPLSIDSLSVSNAYVRYTERYPDSPTPGYIDFHDIQAEFTNITNQDSAETLYAYLQGDMYGQAPLRLSVQFPLSENAKHYTYDGRLGALHLPATNRILKYGAPLYFTSGDAQELSFSARANSEYAEGSLKFFYENLEVAIKKEKMGLLKELLFGFVEWTAFPQDNLPGEKFRKGQIYYKRDPTRSFFSYLWRSVLSGLKSTMLPNIVLPDEKEHKVVKRE